MRTHLLATVAAVALLAALPAHAQDATWLLNPGSGNFNTAANWTPATVPTGTAFFGTSNITSLSFSANTAVGGWAFNAGAPAYTFTVPSGPVLTFNGAGISGTAAGNPVIINNGSIVFLFSSTAGNANITNNGFLEFVNSSNQPL
jgi:fibronectin-binding autotransporter adhesin